MTIEEINKKGGDAYISDNSGKICLVRCPECHKENYAFNVTSGVCTWCGWDANP